MTDRDRIVEGLASEVERMRSERDEARARVASLEADMRHIREVAGVVCDHYEVCQHPTCESSYAAWETADRALLDAEGVTVDEMAGTFQGGPDSVGWLRKQRSEGQTDVE
jgi:hypothetical protein